MYFVLHHLFICCTVYVYVLCIFQWTIFLKNHGLYIFKCKYKVSKSYRLFSIHIKCWLKFLLIEGYPSCIGFQNWESNSHWYTCTSIHTYQLTLNSKNSTTFFIFPNANKQLCHNGMKTRGNFFLVLLLKEFLTYDI